jgi:hypothetical protein
MRVLGLAVLGVLALAARAPAAELVLAADGKSNYRIVIALDASIQDHYAAAELQRYVEEMSAARLPIVTDNNALTAREIMVGFSRHTTRVCATLKRESFRPEEFAVKRVGESVLVVGGTPRGTLYGVISLLTDEWGCRWFSPALKRIPKHPRLTLGEVDRRYSPPFEYREAYFWSGLDNEWAVHNFQHGQFAKQTAEQGGSAGYAPGWFVHTALRLVPPDIYLKEHPDYFWREPRKMVNAGSTATGLCLTHPDVARITAQTILDKHREEPDGNRLYSVSAGDCNDWCECPRCMEEYKRIGEKHGQVGRESVRAYPFGVAWLRFAGKVAGLLESEPAADRPRLSMLAYGYSPLPPSKPERFRDVNVMYAELAACQFHALDDPKCPDNADYRLKLRGWLASSGSTYVWLYKVNFDNHWFWVHPNMQTFAADLRYLRSVGVKGVFEQGNLYLGDRWDGEFHELRAYLLARLLWNPDLDWRDLRREFCAAYYGEAAGAAMEQYMDDVYDSAIQSGAHCRDHNGKEAFAWVTPEMTSRWTSQLEAAAAQALDEEHRRLVRVSRLHVQFTEASLCADPALRKSLLQKFLVEARTLGVTYIGPAPQFLEAWARTEGLN